MSKITIENELKKATARRDALQNDLQQTTQKLDDLKRRQVQALVEGTDTQKLDGEIAGLQDHIAGMQAALQQLDGKVSGLADDLAKITRAEAETKIKVLAGDVLEALQVHYGTLCAALREAEKVEAKYHEMEVLRRSLYIGQDYADVHLSNMIAAAVNCLTEAIEVTPAVVYVNTKAIAPDAIKAIQAKRRAVWAEELALANQAGWAAHNGAHQTVPVEEEFNNLVTV